MLDRKIVINELRKRGYIAEEKNIAERRKKMHTSTFEKSRASPLRNKPQKVF